MRGITGLGALVLALAFSTVAAAQETRWVGAYQCEQGATGATITLTRLPDNQLSAIFHFYPTPDNLGLENASFAMKGAADTDGRAIALRQDHWIGEGAMTYNMFDFSGQISADGQTLSGRINTGACGAAMFVRDH